LDRLWFDADVTAPRGGFDFGPLLDGARERARRAAEFRELLPTLVGTGRSDDGLLTVRCKALGGVTEIAIDPRAMRLDSRTLGERLVTVVNAAKRDLDEQTRRAAAESAGTPVDPDALPDPEAIRERMQAASAVLADVSGDAMALINDLQRRLRP